jgi:hypothetical protein
MMNISNVVLYSRLICTVHIFCTLMKHCHNIGHHLPSLTTKKQAIIIEIG